MTEPDVGVPMIPDYDYEREGEPVICRVVRDGDSFRLAYPSGQIAVSLFDAEGLEVRGLPVPPEPEPSDADWLDNFARKWEEAWVDGKPAADKMRAAATRLRELDGAVSRLRLAPGFESPEFAEALGALYRGMQSRTDKPQYPGDDEPKDRFLLADGAVFSFNDKQIPTILADPSSPPELIEQIRAGEHLPDAVSITLSREDAEWWGTRFVKSPPGDDPRGRLFAACRMALDAELEDGSDQ